MGITRLALCFVFAGSLVVACAGGGNTEKTGGGSKGSGGSGGSGGSSNCGASVICSGSLSYKQCTSKSGACTIELSTGGTLSCSVPASDRCTASPDGGGGTSGTGGTGGTSGSGGTGGMGAEGGVPEADTSCVSMGSSGCISCCQTMYGEGATTFSNALATCACTSPGACASECGTNACAGTTATSACTSCLMTALGMSGACYTPVLDACNADPVCVSYVNCGNGCP